MFQRPPQKSTSSAWHFQELRLSLKSLLLFQTILPLLPRLETHLLPPSLADGPCTVPAVARPILNPNKSQSHPLRWCVKRHKEGRSLIHSPKAGAPTVPDPSAIGAQETEDRRMVPCPNRQSYFLSSFAPKPGQEIRTLWPPSLRRWRRSGGVTLAHGCGFSCLCG